jgi:high-affinity nickel-transport protein
VTLFAVLAVGFVLGLRHATDADHVVAITALMSRERSPRAALVLGAFWGLGHSFTILCVGGAIVAFGLAMPRALGLSLEMSVAVMLVLLGVLNLTGAGKRAETAGTARREAAEGGVARDRSIRETALRLVRRGGRSLAIGIVHGLAGSAAVALLVLTTLRDTRSALAYLAVFGSGTILGMMLVTATLAVPIRIATARFRATERVLARATGALSLAFGLFLAYRIGFVDGLLLGEP